MTTTTRRVFMMQVAVSSSAALAAAHANAAVKKIEENEPKAMSLGYRHNTAQVDAKRFPKHKASEQCSGCMAWLGKPTDAWAECDLLADRMVSNTGWCSSFVKTK
jgi:hypothetical protein